MTKAYLMKKVTDALIVGIRDHGPMTVYQMEGFLRGYGIELVGQVVDVPSYLRLVMFRRRHLFKAHSQVGREVRYTLISEK